MIGPRPRIDMRPATYPGKVIQGVREKLGLNQLFFAALLGVYKSTPSRWEKMQRVKVQWHQAVLIRGLKMLPAAEALALGERLLDELRINGVLHAQMALLEVITPRVEP